jgi:hypothetical protein
MVEPEREKLEEYGLEEEFVADDLADERLRLLREVAGAVKAYLDGGPWLRDRGTWPKREGWALMPPKSLSSGM